MYNDSCDKKCYFSNTPEQSLYDFIFTLDKLSETQGWWKACNKLHRIGYIPKSFVKILHEESPNF